MVRAIGPTAPRSEKGPEQGGRWPSAEMRPGVGLRAQMPVAWAGVRTEPPPSRAEARCRETGGDGGGLASAGAAGGVGKVPRVVGAAVEEVVGLVGHQELGAVGDAEDDGSGRAKAADSFGIVGRNEIAVEEATAFAAVTGNGDGGLDGEGEAVECASRVPLSCRLLGLGGGRCRGRSRRER